MKANISSSLVFAFIVVVLVNFLWNPSFNGLHFNDFLPVFYASISSSDFSMDILTFSQIILVVVAEIAIVWLIFHLVTKKVFSS